MKPINRDKLAGNTHTQSGPSCLRDTHVEALKEVLEDLGRRALNASDLDGLSKDDRRRLDQFAYALSGQCQDAIFDFEVNQMATTDSKSARIDIRTNLRVKELLQKAAAAAHKNVSEFLLDAGMNAAHETLAGRQIYRLDESRWQEFQQALDRPVTSKPRLVKLLSEPSVLEDSKEDP